MAGEDFISLGDANQKHAFDQPSGDKVTPLERPEGKLFGKTQGQKETARKIQLAHKKEKKQAKADAKRQRKENAILHRRMTKNPEKYNKNKERNRQRDIIIERNKIRTEAIKQAEKLAAKHDPSGKMFHIGEVIVLEDGRVKNKAAWEKAQIAKKAKATGVAVVLPGNLNATRSPQIVNTNGKPKNISKKQQKLAAILEPIPDSPRPVVPAGLECELEGKDNFIALWNITDEEIETRLKRAKNVKKNLAKDLRKRQMEQKKFNRAMKVLKKQAAKQGVIFDPEEAKKRILGEEEDLRNKSEKEDEDTSTSGSDSDINSDGEAKEKLIEQKKIENTLKHDENSSSEASSDSNDSSDASSDSGSDGAAGIPEESTSSKKSKRKASESTDEEPAAKKLKTDESSDYPKEKKKPGFNRPKLNMDLITPEGIAERVKKEQKRVRLNEKRKAKLAANIAAGHEPTLIAVGMLKRNRNPEETPEEKLERKRKRSEKKARIAEKRADPVEQERRAKLREGYRKKKEEKKAERKEQRRLEKIEKDRKKKRRGGMTDWEKKRIAERGPESAAGPPRNAEKWNASALSGGQERQDKFRRLLGGGKSTSQSSKAGAYGPNERRMVDLDKAQSELERQFDAGVRMKHEGGGRKLGLGA